MGAKDHSGEGLKPKCIITDVNL
ncbi:hypothetical protein CHELA40_30314 [Chelatococcus asaccharovorans]|nr:hypothetical protein CHELA17_40100 [Chelatococcus asaccharovorans]CAH1688834.1 hypothetical protein CHELA40_30314 [Chelatococcus asaccharovorans]